MLSIRHIVSTLIKIVDAKKQIYVKLFTLFMTTNGPQFICKLFTKNIYNQKGKQNIIPL